MEHNFAIDPRLLNLRENFTHDETPLNTNSFLSSALLGAGSYVHTKATPSIGSYEIRNPESNDLAALSRHFDEPEEDDALDDHAVGHLALWIAKNKSIEPSENQLKGLATVTAIPITKLSKWLVVHGTSLLADVKAVVPYRRAPKLVDKDDAYRVRCVTSDFRYRPRNTLSKALKTFECTNRCGQTFERKGDWSRHEKVNFEEWGCPCCGKVFSRRDKLRNHVNDSHPGVRISKPQKQQFLASEQRACGFCGSTLKQWAAWLTHVAGHFEGAWVGGPKNMSQWREHRSPTGKERPTMSLTQSESYQEVPVLPSQTAARVVATGIERVNKEADLGNSARYTYSASIQPLSLSEDTFGIRKRNSQGSRLHKDRRHDVRRDISPGWQSEGSSSISTPSRLSLNGFVPLESSPSSTALAGQLYSQGLPDQIQLERDAAFSKSAGLSGSVSSSLNPTSPPFVSNLPSIQLAGYGPSPLVHSDSNETNLFGRTPMVWGTDHSSIYLPPRMKSASQVYGAASAQYSPMSHGRDTYRRDESIDLASVANLPPVSKRGRHPKCDEDSSDLDDMDSLVDHLIGHRISVRDTTETSVNRHAIGPEVRKNRNSATHSDDSQEGRNAGRPRAEGKKPRGGARHFR